MNNYDAVPAELKARPQWVCWRSIQRGGDKPTKVPFQPDGTPAKSDDPTTWHTFDEVCAVEADFTGIGYVFADDDPYVGIDLDDALDDHGRALPGWAAMIARFDTYCEVSPSGMGVKMWVKAPWPGSPDETGKRVAWQDGQIEAYHRGRYFAVTGEPYDEAKPIREDGEAVAGLYRTILNPPAPKSKPQSKPIANRAARCTAYLAKCPESVSGQAGHDKAFRAACECWRFGLTEPETWDVMRWFNSVKCEPEWSDRELQHKIDDARKKVTADGQLGDKVRDEPQPARIAAPPADTSGLSKRIESMIAGEWVNVEWPWPHLTGMARALLPGTITVMSGVGGSSKSLVMSQACLHWLETGIDFAAFHLEEDREYHELRALAQLSDNGRLTDDRWVKANPDEARERLAEHQKRLTALGASIWDAPASDVTLPDLVTWLGERLGENRRVIVIDPITAADSGERPWAADREFVLAAKRLLRESWASLVVVTHPRNGDPKHGNRVDNHAGGQAYNRFTQCVLMLGASEPKNCMIERESAFGTERLSEQVNRVIRVGKARNGAGTGRDIGYWFDSQSLTFKELGVLEKPE